MRSNYERIVLDCWLNIGISWGIEEGGDFSSEQESEILDSSKDFQLHSKPLWTIYISVRLGWESDLGIFNL